MIRATLILTSQKNNLTYVYNININTISNICDYLKLDNRRSKLNTNYFKMR